MTAARPRSHSSHPSSDLEPERLLAGGGSASERILLESADLDVMPSATARRLARALAVPPLKSHPRPAPAPTRPPLRLVKGLLVGVVGAVIGVGMRAWLTSAAGVAIVASAPATPSARVEASAGVGVAVDAVPPASTTKPDVPRPQTSGVGPATASARPRALPPPPLASRAGSGLLEEARLLEKARSALRAGQGNVAERALADYHTRFARGELELEAQLLDVELLLARGEDQRALSLARQLATRGDATRYRPRLEAQMQRARGNLSTPSDSIRSAAKEGTPPVPEGSKRGRSHMDQARKP
jgi:hypothetical protein